jgi:hypothetical protein
VEVRDHGPLGVWVEGPADVVDQLGPAWAEALGAAVRGWLVRVRPGEGGARTEVRGVRWDPTGARTALATIDDDDADDPETLPAEIARELLQIVLEMYEQLHHDDARVERWTMGRG